MDYTYDEASELFGVSKVSIGKWVTSGKLIAGEKYGLQKTVTKASVDEKLSSPGYMLGVKKSVSRSNSQSELESLRQEIISLRYRIEALENNYKRESNLEKVRKGYVKLECETKKQVRIAGKYYRLTLRKKGKRTPKWYCRYDKKDIYIGINPENAKQKITKYLSYSKLD